MISCKTCKETEIEQLICDYCQGVVCEFCAKHGRFCSIDCVAKDAEEVANQERIEHDARIAERQARRGDWA